MPFKVALRRFAHYTQIIAALLVLCAGCTAGSPPSAPPTVVVAQATALPTLKPSPPGPTATYTPLAFQRATAEATLTPTLTYTPDATALRVENTFATLRSSEITFTLYVTPQAAPVKSARVEWTFAKSKTVTGKNAVVPPQTPERAVKLETSIFLDQVPVDESTLTYHWTVIDEYGNRLQSKDGTFKITEAPRNDARDDLPIIKATTTFKSNFPDSALFTVTVQPENSITNARFFITQNHGLVIEDYEARIQKAGQKAEPVTFSFQWDKTFSLQIPWQAFETWWVFTDDFGHVFRTEHVFNDYADKRHAWLRTETKYTILYTYGQSAANLAFYKTAADTSVEDLQREFDYKLIYKPHIVIYSTYKDYLEWDPPQDEGVISAIGVASGQWGGLVAVTYNSVKFTAYTIVRHELTHVFQFQSVQRPLPQWFIEGTARYMETYPEIDGEKFTRGMVKQYGAPSLQMGLPLISPDKKTNAWPYHVGQTVIKFLKTQYGNDALGRLYLALARAMEFGDAIKAVTGLTFEQFDLAWQKWIAS